MNNITNIVPNAIVSPCAKLENRNIPYTNVTPTAPKASCEPYAIAGGFVIAFSEIMITYPYKKFVAYIVPGDWKPEGLVQLLATDYKFAVSFIILVLVLLFRPTGIFAGKSV